MPPPTPPPPPPPPGSRRAPEDPGAKAFAEALKAATAEVAKASADLKARQAATAAAMKAALAVPAAGVNPAAGTAAGGSTSGGLGAAIKEALGKTKIDVAALMGGIGSAIKEALSRTRIDVAALMGGIGTAVRETFLKLRTDLSSPLATVKGIIGATFTNTVAGAQGLAGGLGKAMGAAGAAVSKVMAPIKAIEGAIAAVSSQVGRFVQLANPAAFQQFNLAVDDLMATVGRALTPVLQAATSVVRTIGSAINAAAPAFEGLFDIFRSAEMKSAIAQFGQMLAGVLTRVGEAFSALAPVLQPLIGIVLKAYDVLYGLVGWAADVLKDLAPALTAVMKVVTASLDAVKPLLDVVATLFTEVLGGALRAVGKVVEAVAPVVQMLAEGIGKLLKVVKDVVGWILALVGIDVDAATTAPTAAVKDNTGMAVKNVTWSDPAASVKAAMAEALKVGLGAGGDPAKATAQGVTGLHTTVKDFFGRFWDKMGEALGKLAGDIAAAMTGGLSKKVAGAVENVAGAVGEAWKNTFGPGIGPGSGGISDKTYQSVLTQAQKFAGGRTGGADEKAAAAAARMVEATHRAVDALEAVTTGQSPGVDMAALSWKLMENTRAAIPGPSKPSL